MPKLIESRQHNLTREDFGYLSLWKRERDSQVVCLTNPQLHALLCDQAGFVLSAQGKNDLTEALIRVIEQTGAANA